MDTRLKIINGVYTIKSVNNNGDTTYHLEAWYVDTCLVDKWYAIEAKSEQAKRWFEDNGFSEIRRDFLVHIRDKNEFLRILRLLEKIL